MLNKLLTNSYNGQTNTKYIPFEIFPNLTNTANGLDLHVLLHTLTFKSGFQLPCSSVTSLLLWVMFQPQNWLRDRAQTTGGQGGAAHPGLYNAHKYLHAGTFPSPPPPSDASLSADVGVFILLTRRGKHAHFKCRDMKCAAALATFGIVFVDSDSFGFRLCPKGGRVCV